VFSLSKVSFSIINLGQFDAVKRQKWQSPEFE